MKHLFQSLLLLLALILPATATAHDFYVDGIYYNINGNEAEVTCRFDDQFGDYRYSGDVTIPTTVTYNGTTYSVTAIGESAFSGCSGLTSMTIPNSVTTIDNRAFFGCSGLTSVTIPNSVTTIGGYAFYNCTALSDLIIPSSVTTIGDRAFSGTAWSANQPEGLIYAGLVCLGYKGTLLDRTNIIIKEGTLVIANDAFNNEEGNGYGGYFTDGLSSITIPCSVTHIGNEAFRHINLDSVIIRDLEAWCKIQFGPFQSNPCDEAHHLYLNNEEIKDLIIPNSITDIGNYAFSGCRGLTSVTIPNSVTTIGDNAFHDCSGLTSIIIPNSVTTIGDFAFCMCYGLTSMTIPNSVTTIGDYAFDNCSGLKNFTIPNSVTSIGEGAFHSSDMTSVTIPNSVTFIGGCAFECPELTDVYCYITDLSNVSMNSAFVGRPDYSGLTLHVLPGMLSAYQNDERWYPYFGQIVEMDVPITSIELDKYAATMTEGESLQLTATVLPEYASTKTLAWSSSNAAVATVDDDGLVTAHSVGTATITAMTTDGSNLSASCVVTVKSLSATECLSMPDGEVLHGEAITIPVRMTNAATVLAFQTDIFLPEGFTIDTNEDNEPIVTPSSRLTDDHIIMTQVANNGAMRVVCYTPTMQPISGNEGDLFYITVNVPADAAGDYAVYLRNSRLTIDDFTEVRIPDAGAVIDVKTYIPGDVNDTHSVNVADIVTTVRYVLDMNPSPFIFDAADMNGDGEVTVTDIMLIARLILYPTMNAPRQAPVQVANGDRMSGEGITLSAGETRTVSINLDNARDYSAFQLDLRLPEGLSATNFRLTERAANHALEVNTLRDGRIRALCYTPAIEAIYGNNGAVLTFDVTATSAVDGNITVDGIELVTTACQGVRLDAFTIGVQTATAVTELSSGKTVAKVEYFNLAGQRLTRPTTGVTLIVTTYTDGTRTTTKRLD